MASEYLETPPTEIEIAKAIEACSEVPIVKWIIRRLAFQRAALQQATMANKDSAMTLDEAKQIIERMLPDDRAELIQWLDCNFCEECGCQWNPDCCCKDDEWRL